MQHRKRERGKETEAWAEGERGTKRLIYYKNVLFMSTTGTKGRRGGKKYFDEGWCCSGWVHDNSWAEDFPPLSIIFNGLRDRQVTETNPDGSGKKITRVWQWWVYEEGSLRWQWRLLNATQHKSGGCAGIAETTSSKIVSSTYLRRNCCSTFPERQSRSISASRRGRTQSAEAPLTGQKLCVVSAFCCNSEFVFSPNYCCCTSSRHKAIRDFSSLSVSTKSLTQKRIWATRTEKNTTRRFFFFHIVLRGNFVNEVNASKAEIRDQTEWIANEHSYSQIKVNFWSIWTRQHHRKLPSEERMLSIKGFKHSTGTKGFIVHYETIPQTS